MPPIRKKEFSMISRNEKARFREVAGLPDIYAFLSTRSSGCDAPPQANRISGPALALSMVVDADADEVD